MTAPNRKFQPGDEIEPPTSGYKQDRRCYILGYTRAGEIVIENDLGVVFGQFNEDLLRHKRSLEDILLRALIAAEYADFAGARFIAKALRDAGCIKDGW